MNQESQDKKFGSEPVPEQTEQIEQVEQKAKITFPPRTSIASISKTPKRNSAGVRFLGRNHNIRPRSR